MYKFSKRFHEKTNSQLLHFHSSISFDKRLAKYDIEGSIAHVEGLAKQKIILESEAELIKKALNEILNDIIEKKFEFSEDLEDIHMNIEKELIDKIGDTGKKLHTGRSRNDQVALDMKLFVRDELKNTISLLETLIKILILIAEKNLDTYMPAFTHLQKAQATTFAHYLMAYVEMFHRDVIRLKNTIDLLNFSPLGAAALTGSTHNLDRKFTAEFLKFTAPTNNSLDSVSDRDYIIDSIHNFSMIMLHLSRFCEEIIIFSSQDYNYIEVSDDFSTGSSIMPQKKNPDAAELIRGKSGRVFGHLISLLTTIKGLSLAYNKDLQEDKEAFFDALDTTQACISVFSSMVEKIKINKERMEKACYNGYIEATDIADYLVRKGVTFRDAYAIVGEMVKDAIRTKIIFPNFSLSDYKNYSELFEEDIFDSISLKTMIEARHTSGSPKMSNVKSHIELIKSFYKFL